MDLTDVARADSSAFSSAIDATASKSVPSFRRHVTQNVTLRRRVRPDAGGSKRGSHVGRFGNLVRNVHDVWAICAFAEVHLLGGELRRLDGVSSAMVSSAVAFGTSTSVPKTSAMTPSLTLTIFTEHVAPPPLAAATTSMFQCFATESACKSAARDPREPCPRSASSRAEILISSAAAISPLSSRASTASSYLASSTMVATSDANRHSQRRRRYRRSGEAKHLANRARVRVRPSSESQLLASVTSRLAPPLRRRTRFGTWR